MVPVTGIEPVRILLRGILSPLCLPVPPHRRLVKNSTFFPARQVSQLIQIQAERRQAML